MGNSQALLAHTLSEFLSHVASVREDWRRADPNLEPAFRGHGSSEWELKPTFYRDLVQPGADTETRLLEEFRRAAQPYMSPPPLHHLGWLIVGQHHGLPTRLLDWSESPLAALHFAVEGAGNPDGPRVVWCLNPAALNRLSDDRTDPQRPPVFFDDASARLRTGLKLQLNAFEAGGDPVRKSRAYYFKPPALSARIVAQRGTFTLFGRDADALEDLRQSHGPKILVPIAIPPQCAGAVREELELAGVTHASMFPDLDGVAKAVKAQELRLTLPAPCPGEVRDVPQVDISSTAHDTETDATSTTSRTKFT